MCGEELLILIWDSLFALLGCFVLFGSPLSSPLDEHEPFTDVTLHEDIEDDDEDDEEDEDDGDEEAELMSVLVGFTLALAGLLLSLFIAAAAEANVEDDGDVSESDNGSDFMLSSLSFNSFE